MHSIPEILRSGFERAVALVLLLVLSLTLFLIGLVLHFAGGTPVLITDQVFTKDRILAKSLRFRTTGHGSALFHDFGRFLRRYEIDELPGLWSVVRGDIRLTEILRRVF